ncbi:MAG: glycine dehydrogenase [Planctomycetota bacterium]|jgi:glycine dehydrogenase subunit 1
MDYTQITPDEQVDMLAAIGAADLDELFSAIPPSIRFAETLDLPPARSELELQRDLAEMTAHNHGAHDMVCFMGGGAYDHFYPVLIDDLISRGEFLTAYTPYQAEASQGCLQAFFEFQTQVARLSGLGIANASLYEGATAVAEAVLMALHTTGKRRVLAASTLHPDYLTVLRTYLSDLPAELVELPATGGRIAPDTVRDHLDDDTAAVAVASPNVWGQVGLLAAHRRFIRKLPGRLIGRTVDADGRPAYCLTLQTREQHIRGARATSNICTNQGLLALRATMFMTALGKQGLREMAEQCHHKARYLAGRIAELPGYGLKFDGPFFHEFCVTCPKPAAQIIQAAKRRGILAGVAPHHRRLNRIGEPEDLLIAVTEKRTRAEMDALVKTLGELAE